MEATIMDAVQAMAEQIRSLDFRPQVARFHVSQYGKLKVYNVIDRLRGNHLTKVRISKTSN